MFAVTNSKEWCRFEAECARAKQIPLIVVVDVSKISLIFIHCTKLILFTGRQAADTANRGSVYGAGLRYNACFAALSNHVAFLFAGWLFENQYALISGTELVSLIVYLVLGVSRTTANFVTKRIR